MPVYSTTSANQCVRSVVTTEEAKASPRVHSRDPKATQKRLGHSGTGGRRQYTIRLKPEIHTRLKKQARAAHQTLAEYIESLVGG